MSANNEEESKRKIFCTSSCLWETYWKLGKHAKREQA